VVAAADVAGQAVGTSYFFLKFMRYALLFWLPFYYESSLGYDPSLSGYLSTSFELGGTLGTPLIGYISDQYMSGRRDLTAGLFMSGAACSLTACVLLSTWGPSVNAACMFLTGVLVIGPDSVLSGTIAQDIGQRSGLGR
jgi:sugar phosphate permease